MEKIVKIEQQLASGKALDQEQLALLNSKKSVEKALADVAALKAQLEEVAKQQLVGVLPSSSGTAVDMVYVGGTTRKGFCRPRNHRGS